MSSRELKHSINQAFKTVVHHTQSAEWLYLYDDSTTHYTYLETYHNERNSLLIYNRLKIENAHYCVDGGLIPYGQEIYGHNFRKRCDSLLVTDHFLFIIELKMNIDPNSSDKTKWGDFAIALQQIEQFYHYLHSIIPDFQDKCKGLRIVPFIGIKLPPNLNKKTNTQRWNEIVTFSTATHLKIRFGEELDPLNI